MNRYLPLVIIAVLTVPATALAEHSNIELRIIRLDAQTGQSKDQAESHADADPPEGGVNPRPLLKVQASDPLVLQFFYTNTYPHAEIKDVTVSYFVVKEEKPRQKKVPPLSLGVVTHGQFTMNFKPKCRVGARVEFTIKEPGFYLVRIQSGNTKSDHEHFSAIDIQVEKPD